MENFVGRSDRIQGLDLLRSIAIVMVMFSHLPAPTPGSFLGFAKLFGAWGVDLFFVLSAYLIGHQVFSSFSRGIFSCRNFYARRILRTWPPYFVVIGIYILFPYFRERNNLPSPLALATFTQNFNMGATTFGHSWSLCVEEHFYLVFPIFCLLFLGRMSNFTPVFLVVALILAGIIVRWIMWDQYVALDLSTRKIEYYRRIYYPTWTRLDGIVIGVALAAIRNFRPELWRRLSTRGNWMLGIGGVLTAIVLGTNSNQFGFVASVFGFPMFALAFAFLVIAAIDKNSILNRCRVPLVAAVAAVSYSTYLLHVPIFRLVEKYLVTLNVPSSSALTAIANITSALIVATIFYWIVEWPILGIRKKYFRL